MNKVEPSTVVFVIMGLLFVVAAVGFASTVSTNKHETPDTTMYKGGYQWKKLYTDRLPEEEL